MRFEELFDCCAERYACSCARFAKHPLRQKLPRPLPSLRETEMSG
jgi:hypothetical protein